MGMQFHIAPRLAVARNVYVQARELRAVLVVGITDFLWLKAYDI
jgi:hypothetical protein